MQTHAAARGPLPNGTLQMWSEAGLLPPNKVCYKYVYIGIKFLHTVVVCPSIVYNRFKLAVIRLVGPQSDQNLRSGIRMVRKGSSLVK